MLREWLAIKALNVRNALGPNRKGNVMRTYGIGPADVLSAIRESRKAIEFWTARKANNNFRVSVPAEKRAAIVADHNAQIRDLRITLAAIRFDNDSLMSLTSPEFVPFIVTDNVSDDSESVPTDNNADNTDDNTDDNATETVDA